MGAELRDWYLDTLGIVQYRRRDLGAVDIPFHVEPDVEPSDDDTTGEPLAAIVEQFGEKTASPAPQKAPEVQPPQQSGSGQDIAPIEPFRLACWQPCDDLLLLNPLQPGMMPSSDEKALLDNLLRAVGRLSDGNVSTDYIDWPLSPIDTDGLSGARSMLSVFLDVRIRKRGVLWVLVMGELPSTLLLPSQRPYEDVLGDSEELAGGAKAIVVPSLQEMLQSPERKRDTWRALQHLAD